MYLLFYTIIHNLYLFETIILKYFDFQKHVAQTNFNFPTNLSISNGISMPGMSIFKFTKKLCQFVN